MIPTKKNRKYAIACFGPHDYNRWSGVAIFTGNVDNSDPEDVLYEFNIDGGDDIVWFDESCIICEAVDETRKQLDEMYHNTKKALNDYPKIYVDEYFCNTKLDNDK